MATIDFFTLQEYHSSGSAIGKRVARPLKGCEVDAGLRNMDNHRMKPVIHEIQGYAIVLDKVVFVTRVFEAEEGEGFQFNIRFAGEMRLAPKFPTRHEADLQRRLFIQALRGEIQG